MRARLWCSVVLSLAFSPCTFAQLPSTLNSNSSSLYVEVQLDKSVKLSSLKPGDVTEGTLARDVYSVDRRILATGSHIRLTVDHVERQRKLVNDHWPWVVRAFAPRHENLPVFKEAAVSTPNGMEKHFQVALISADRRTNVHPQSRRHQKKEDETVSINGTSSTHSAPASHLFGHRAHRALGPMISLAAREQESDTFFENTEPIFASSARPITVPSGMECKILLLKGISASKNHAGDVLQARLLEPVLVGSDAALPAGSTFEGTVQKAHPPRWLSRAGSLSLTFTRVILPDGSWFPLSASLTEVQVNRGSHTKIDAEGRLEGDRPGMKWMLINGGVTGGIAKEVDDGTQLILEAILSGATDASTAGTARIAGSVVSGIFMATRHGRDVILPDFTDMTITLTRPLNLLVQVAKR